MSYGAKFYIQCKITNYELRIKDVRRQNFRSYRKDLEKRREVICRYDFIGLMTLNLQPSTFLPQKQLETKRGLHWSPLFASTNEKKEMGLAFLLPENIKH
ncbi:MAG: hypothetical protein ACLGGV_08940 [Bacteroidia bacterium]